MCIVDIGFVVLRFIGWVEVYRSRGGFGFLVRLFWVYLYVYGIWGFIGSGIFIFFIFDFLVICFFLGDF